MKTIKHAEYDVWDQRGGPTALRSHCEIPLCDEGTVSGIFCGKRNSMRLMLNNIEVIDELSMNQESASPAWAMFGIVLLLPGKKELGKCQNYLGARRPWSLFADKILWKVTTTTKKWPIFSQLLKQDHDLQSKTQTARRWSREWPAAFCSAPRTALGGSSGTRARLAAGAAPGWVSLHSCSLPPKWSPKAAREETLWWVLEQGTLSSSPW